MFHWFRRRPSRRQLLDKLAEYREENQRLFIESLRYYHTDGSYEHLGSADEVIARRVAAAREIERLQRKLSEARQIISGFSNRFEPSTGRHYGLLAQADRFLKSTTEPSSTC